MTTQVLVLNGPNLARLGSREPDVYGATTYNELTQKVSQWAEELGLTVEVRQTDDEAEMISWLHEAADHRYDVVFNPAAFTHYSYSIRDAAAQVGTEGGRVIEVHLTNPAARERFRGTSVVSGICQGTIAGFGVQSYEFALRALANR